MKVSSDYRRVYKSNRYRTENGTCHVTPFVLNIYIQDCVDTVTMFIKDWPYKTKIVNFKTVLPDLILEGMLTPTHCFLMIYIIKANGKA
jgi:hypothetical protein